MPTKRIDFTSPLSEQEAPLVPLTPVFTKSSSQLVMGDAGILPFSRGVCEKTVLLNFPETKLHKAMLLHLACSPTRDLEQGEATGRADIKVASLYRLPLQQNLPEGFHSSAAHLPPRPQLLLAREAHSLQQSPNQNWRDREFGQPLHSLRYCVTSLETLTSKG